jgi:GMP synthase-like glutamine amidotransferase
MGLPRVAFLVHSPVDLPGLLEERARALGLPVTVHHLYRGPGEAPSPGSFDLLVILGSSRSVNDAGPSWLDEERRLVGRAAEDEVPIFGVCFGGQLLAQVLGGRVQAGRRPEIGWRSLRSSDPELIEPGPWLVWHGEVFEPPPGASLLAETDLAPHAFTLGQHLGIQFHPEVTADLLRVWVDRATERGRLSPEEASEVLAGAEAQKTGAVGRAERLFDAQLRRSGLLPPTPGGGETPR